MADKQCTELQIRHNVGALPTVLAILANVAQAVEQQSEKLRVTGAAPVVGTILTLMGSSP